MLDDIKSYDPRDSKGETERDTNPGFTIAGQSVNYTSFAGGVLSGVLASTSWTIDSVARPKPGFDAGLDLPCTLVV